jgi:hypothetical protein
MHQILWSGSPDLVEWITRSCGVDHQICGVDHQILWSQQGFLH